MENKKPSLQSVTVQPADIRCSTSSSGNAYCALVLPNGDWIFAMEWNSWYDELERNTDIYLDLELEIVYRDSNQYDEDEDAFFSIEYVVPSDPEMCARLMKYNQKKHQ